MKIKSIVKIIIDIAMTGLFIALLFAYQTGLAFHEIMGLSIVFLFALHMILNGKWIIGVTKKLFSDTLKMKTLLMYFFNTGLLIGIAVITVSGILISSVLFPVSSYNQTLVTLHKWLSYVTAGMMGVHLLLHVKYMGSMFKKIAIGLKTPVVRRTLSSTAAILFIAGIVYYNVVSATEKSMTANIIEAADNGQSVESKYTVSDTPPDTSSTASFELSSAVSSEQTIDSSSESKKEESSSVMSVPSSQPADTVSLSEFLGKMFCTICPKHCPLSHPQCRKSASLIQQATTEYNELYSN